MSIDISQLSAAELDQLIAEAAQRRAQLNPPVAENPPERVHPLLDPRWYTIHAPAHDGTLILLIRHPGLGWIAIALPPLEAANLANYWTGMLAATSPAGAEALRQRAAVASATTAPGGSGGKLH